MNKVILLAATLILSFSAQAGLTVLSCTSGQGPIVLDLGKLNYKGVPYTNLDSVLPDVGTVMKFGTADSDSITVGSFEVTSKVVNVPSIELGGEACEGGYTQGSVTDYYTVTGKMKIARNAEETVSLRCLETETWGGTCAE